MSFHTLLNKSFSCPLRHLHRHSKGLVVIVDHKIGCAATTVTDPMVTVLITCHPQQLLGYLSSIRESRLKVSPPAKGSTSSLGYHSIRLRDETYSQVGDKSFCPHQLIWWSPLYKDSNNYGK